MISGVSAIRTSSLYFKNSKESEDTMPIITRCDRCNKRIAPSTVYKLAFSNLLTTELVCEMELCPDCVRGILKYIDPYKAESMINKIQRSH
jgi:hypothetical protein